MSIVISNMSIPPGCQKCKFFKKHPFGNGLDYSYSCVLGAKDFPMPWIRQMEERASDCPIKPLEQEPVLDKIRAEIEKAYCKVTNDYDRGRNYGLYMATEIINKYRAESEPQESEVEK